MKLPNTVARMVRPWSAPLRLWQARFLALRAALGQGGRPMEPRWLELFDDPAFTRSLREVRDLSALDTPRLANLWHWCGASGPGTILEVGTFRGGTALHLSNRWPARKVVACDTFAGFAPLAFDRELDHGVRLGTWENDDADAVEALFRRKGRDIAVLKGVFPESDVAGAACDVSFAHIDVDLYESCRRSLDYVAARAAPQAIIVVNDYLRSCTRGIARAVAQFCAEQPQWLALPVYPGQGVLIERTTVASGAAPRAAALDLAE